MYDPQEAPRPADWLALDEQQRITLALQAHPGPFPDALHAESGGEMMHSALHAIIETQIATDEPAITAATLNRLMDEGLRRHPALHMIMQVMAQQLVQAGAGAATPASWAAALHALKAGDAVGEALRGRIFGDDAARAGEPMNRAQRRAAKRKGKKQP